MSNSKNPPPNSTATEQAVEWFIDLQADGAAQKREAFVDWLRRSPVHVEEFLQLTALQGDLARLPAFKDIDVSALLTEASVSDSPGNVISLNRGSRASSALNMGGHGGARRAGLIGAVAAATVLALGLGLYAPISDFLGTERYTTAVGQQRLLTLADGSQVQLNVRSSLSAKVNETLRDLRLEEGEALFTVAKDEVRPFRVRTPQATIEATGTQFNVYVKRNRTIVSLLEGHVEITSHEGSAPVLLEPGQELVVGVRDLTTPRPQTLDAEKVTAWTERRLIFEDVPLSEVVDEFNRYSRQPLRIDDPSLRQTRITANFEAGSVEAFAGSLAAAGGLQVTRHFDGSWLIGTH